MPRLAPTLYEFVELDNGDYLKVTEACMRIFDRQDWLRVNRARARIKVLVDKIGIDEFRDAGRGGAEGRLGRRARLQPRQDPVRVRRRGKCAGEAANASLRRTETTVSSRASCETNVQRQRQRGFSTVEVKVTRGDLTPEQLRGLAQIMRDYTGDAARTTVHQNLILRWVRDESVYDVWRRARRARARRRRRRRDHRRRQLPRHRLLQARDHELDGAQPGDPGPPRRRWRSATS